ncbi:MAG: 3-phosphoglycerate dehydrogenase [Chloroflexi bacterium]|nr:3-phosphoglycerate dehydrogenase [Chloroflexota bacterium]
MPEFTVAFLGYRDEWEMERLRSQAPDNVEIVGTPLGASRDEHAALVLDADVVIPWMRSFDMEMLKSGNKLKLIQALSAGTDYLAVGELAEMGIRVANNHGGNSVAVAEHSVMLMVAAYRQVWQQMTNLYEGDYHGDFFEIWEELHELTNKRVGIIGLGQIGSRVAKRLRGWECEIVYHDAQEFDAEYEKGCNATRVSFDELIETSDIITLHVPLDRTTRGILSDREFEMMKPTAVVINTCRGPVIDEAALVRALDSKQIAGAGIDVTETEPIETANALKNRRNVVLTPHLAGSSIEAREKALDWAIENASRLAAGKEPGAIILPV